MDSRPRTFSDITPPKPSPTSRPFIVNTKPAQDPMVTKINVSTPDPLPAMRPMVIPPNMSTPTPVAISSVQPLAPVTPPEPTTPPAQTPKFGALQSKIDAHPLFSGVKEKPTKNKSSAFTKILVFIGLILVVLAAVYVLLDAGIINTNINLPFHIFK